MSISKVELGIPISKELIVLILLCYLSCGLCWIRYWLAWPSSEDLISDINEEKPEILWVYLLQLFIVCLFLKPSHSLGFLAHSFKIVYHFPSRDGAPKAWYVVVHLLKSSIFSLVYCWVNCTFMYIQSCKYV